jgi:hypothetical protein
MRGWRYGRITYMPSQKKLVPDLSYDVFLTGEAFRHGAEIILEWLRNAPLADLGDFKYVLMANHAFALELYFKCLLFMDGKKPGKHHELEKHFNDLPPSSQDVIRKRYDEIVNADASLQAEYARLREAGEDPDQTYGFEKALRASSRTFERSRYPYDPAYKTHSYLGASIAQAIRSVIVERHPAWDKAFWNLQDRQRILPTSQAR